MNDFQPSEDLLSEHSPPIDFHQELPPTQLCWHCPTEAFDFGATAELNGAVKPVGQQRALNALRLGASIKSPSHHIYAMGEPGTGKHELLRQAVEAEAKSRPKPYDWCYVNRFDDARRPRVLRLESGRALALKRDMRALISELDAALPAAFESENYRSQRKEIDKAFQQQGAQSFESLQADAEKHQLTIVTTQHGFAIVPVRDGQPLDEQAFQNLPPSEREAAELHIQKLWEQLQKHLEQVPLWQRERYKKIMELDRNVAGSVIRGAIGDLQATYRDHEELSVYLVEVERDLLDHADTFRGAEREPAPFDLETIQSSRVRARYDVNVLVDNSNTQGAPIVYEPSPSHQNLIGRVDNIAHFGALITDFTMIHAGALQRANGGYLILDAVRLLTQPYAWEALKRALLSRQLEIESLGQMLSLINTVTLEPQPMPLDVKVCLVGPRLLYYLLCRHDEDFAALFSVVADFSEYIDRSPEALKLYAELICALAKQAGLRPLEPSAVARTIEHSARMAGDAQRLSAQVRQIAELLREADYYAGIAARQTIDANDIKTAIAEQIQRQDRVHQSMLKEMQRDTIVIETNGSTVAQVNGLSVIDLGSVAFGQPARITATVRMGEGEVVDIEREVKLGGAIHSKGVLTLSAFITARYAQRTPLSLRASLAFEQTYGKVEGDSASLAETCALLSALANAPMQQSLAVTGSIDQHGAVQAVGGINEKVEGFFDLCRLRNLTGTQGVLIPEANVQHLMLRQDVVDAVTEGLFHVYAVRSVDAAMHLLTGNAVGERQADGKFSAGTINARVEKRLIDFARCRQGFMHEAVERRKISIQPLKSA